MKAKQVAAVACVFLTSAAAFAQPPASRPPDRDEPSSAQRRSAGDFEHDGFYLRFGFGFGGVTDVLASEDENAEDERAEATISGVASVGELMIGSALSSRFVLGGGVWTSTVLVSDYSPTDGDPVPTDLRDPDNFTVVGPFGDWYFRDGARRLGAGGFHVQGGLGLGILNGFRPEQAHQDETRVALGPGMMVGAGYEWWVHEQWAMGVLARVTAAGLIEEDDRGDLWYHGVATFPAFLLSGTYN